MSGQNSRRIRTDLRMVGDITKFRIIQEVNNHGSCILEGMVAHGCEDSFVKENNHDTRVTVTMSELDDESSDIILLVGIIGELSIYQDGAFYCFKIKLYSATLLMDLEKKSRSFQNADMTYKELISKILADYDGGDTIDRLSREKNLGKLLVQYQETDWEFLKRLASHFHGGLLAACEFGVPKVYFGAKSKTISGTMEQHDYTVEKQMLQYRRLSANGYSDFMEPDAICYTVANGEYYELGSEVIYLGISLCVSRLEAELVKGEIVFRYQLRSEKGMGKQTIYADYLTGASIQAEVLDVIKDKVKVKLDIDDSQDVDTAWEFPYQTMYTAGEAGGWYCMPEKGDTIMVYFPSNREQDAVAATSSRGSDGAGERMENPRIKYFRTRDGKEIRFTPDAVEIICEDADGETTAQITLHQEDGIELYSRNGITFTSEKGIRLEAEDEIEITASERIRLHCKKSRIQMDTMVDIAGPDVRIN